MKSSYKTGRKSKKIAKLKSVPFDECLIICCDYSLYLFTPQTHFEEQVERQNKD